MNRKSSQQIEFGDFQTPLPLAEEICDKLQTLGIHPDCIVEPTCGQGNFILAAYNHFANVEKFVGVEINPTYLNDAQQKLATIPSSRLALHHGDFFTFDWRQLLEGHAGKLLILGNLPWVTNSQLGVLSSENLPTKSNFQERSGINAMTGASNFDISEWMLLQIIDWLEIHGGVLAILCKTHTARKVLEQLHGRQTSPAIASIYLIDAQLHFDAAVDACLFLCDFAPGIHRDEYVVYAGLSDIPISHVGYRNGHPIRDLETFDAVAGLYGQSAFIWRSGIKHDCAKVMELTQRATGLTNGLGESIQIESTYLFPLLKSSDIANGRVDSTNRYVLVPQTSVGQPTNYLRIVAPRTWTYLLANAEYLDQRKSQIYRNNPRFSIFGVGDYTFASWKIAISGLYKELRFGLVGPIDGKPTIFDDTVYYLSFEQEADARMALESLNRVDVQNFYESQIFWDDKRPIKANILNRLALQRLLAPTYPSNDDLPLFQVLTS